MDRDAGEDEGRAEPPQALQVLRGWEGKEEQPVEAKSTGHLALNYQPEDPEGSGEIQFCYIFHDNKAGHPSGAQSRA